MAAARRALELNSALPEAWAVLAEVAEEEMRWGESEDLFLRALYVDPTNAYVNTFYSEALLARGRVRDSLHYALEAYRYEPAATGRADDFVRLVSQRRVEDPSSALVRVMTVHQAKGLQFDIVVLPELDNKLTGQSPKLVVGRPRPTAEIERVCRYTNQRVQRLLGKTFY